MLLKHKKMHVVFPGDCNSMGTIFGGNVLSLADLCCFEHSLLLLRGTDCDDAVTVNFSNVNFIRGPKVGDLIEIESTLTKVGIKSLQFLFLCSIMGETVTEGSCVFVARKNGTPYKHGLKLES